MVAAYRIPLNCFRGFDRIFHSSPGRLGRHLLWPRLDHPRERAPRQHRHRGALPVLPAPAVDAQGEVLGGNPFLYTSRSAIDIDTLNTMF